MARFCANCGTEVDESAIFCPTCGQPIDEAAETEMPPAPAWPEPAPSRAEASEPDDLVAAAPSAGWAAPPPAEDAPTRMERRVDPPPAEIPPLPAQPAAARHEPPAPGAAPMNVPIAMPVTLSAWLVGVGAVLAALGVLIGLFDAVLNPIELILLIALLGVAATVFFSSSLPDIANLPLITLVVVLIGFGIALDRLSFGAAGVGELLLFLGTAAAAIGVIVLELGHDQPLGGASA
ncbi:MAG TPA: zinc ribbon domain-containing protein [Candidatus Limnocylindria bacterium]|nr:zinc ribbon domain-containing protein [Candidatus Limnocylindria bacterium]